MNVTHNLKFAALSVAVLTVAATAAFWHPTAVAAQATPDPGSAAFYTAKVQPILNTNCYKCHGNGNHRGGLALDTKAGMMKGGKDGAVLVPGDPANSLLIKLIRHEGPADDPMPMPPRSKISDDDIATVTAWVKGGAHMPDDPAQ